MLWNRIAVTWALVGVGAGLAGCSSNPLDGAQASNCSTGDEGCDCFGNQTCNDDLVCLSNKCVDPGGSGSSASGSKGGGSSNGGGSTNGNGGASQNGSSNGATDAGGTSSGSTSSGSGNNSSGGNSSGSTPGNGGTGAGNSGGNPGPATFADTPVGRHGQLSVQGTQMVDEHGDQIQLKGVSSMWLNWDPAGYAVNKQGMQWMRDNWGMTVFRAAMGAALPDGATGTDDTFAGNPEFAEGQVRTIVENAIELGVYVIIDWHDHHAEDRQSAAQGFFAKMAADYGDKPNVLYEIYNEPLDISWSSELKPYHQALSGTIRDADPDNIIILGTPNWSQDVDIAAQDPVSGSNFMYTLHFYACSHGSELRAKAQAAYSDGLPLFVTEWGAAHADGGVDGVVCEGEAAAWHDWMDSRKIGWAAWKLDGCTDSTCFFKNQNAPAGGGWTASDLNGHAEFAISRMLEGSDVSAPGGGSGGSGGAGGSNGGSGGNDGCVPTGTCADGDGMDCVDGELVERDCSGCEILACGTACCDALGSFGADTYPDFVLRTDLVSSFSQSATQAEMTVDFTAGEQLGAISFAMTEARYIDAGSFEIDMSPSGDGTLAGAPTISFEDGEAGCLYSVYEFDTNQYYLYSEITCWGGFALYDPVRQINVRLDSASSGSGSLVVRELRF